MVGIMYRAIIEAEGILKIKRLTRKVEPNIECLFILKIRDNKEIVQREHPSRNG